MIRWLQRILAPPVFDNNEDKTRCAWLLNAIVLAIFVSVLAYSVFAPIEPQFWIRRLLIVGPLLLLLGGVFWLMHQGYVYLASALVIAGFWLTLTIISFRNGGVLAPAYNGYIVIILIAGMLLGWRVGITGAALSILTGLFFVFGASNDILPPIDAPHTPLAVWVAQSAFFFVAAVLLGLASYNINNAIKRARRELEEKQQAEQKLRESQYQLRLALDAAHMGTWNWKIGTSEVQWSEQIAPMFGLHPGEIAGTYSAYLELLHPADRLFIEENLAAVLDGQIDSFQVEPRVIWPDGSIHWHEGRGQVFRDSSGQPLYMAGTVVDITERKRSEEQLRQQKLRAEALAELSQLLAEFSQDYRKVLDIVVERITELIGDSCSVRLLSQDGQWLELVAIYHADPELVDTARSVISAIPQRSDEGLSGQVIQSGQPLLIPVLTMPQAYTMIKPQYRTLMERYPTYSRLLVPLKVQGQTIGTLELSRFGPGRPYTLDDQAFLQELAHRAGMAISNARLYDALQQELTERKRAERALQESEDRFRRLSEAAFEGLGISEEGRILDANGRLAEMLGYDLPEIIGKELLDFVAPESVETVLKHRRIGSEGPYEHLALRKDGSSFPVEIQSKNLPYEGRTVSLNAFRDISIRKQLEEQLFQAQKMESIGQLAGGVAHDFNNLLTIIISCSEILTYFPAGTIEEHMNEIEQINEAGLRAAALTSQLLAFSRRAMVELRILDLNALITNLIKMLKRLIGEDIELTTLLVAELGKVKADGGQLEQVIMNLVVNARDAMPQGGKLTIETANVYLDAAYVRQHYEVEQEGWYVLLAVSDTGTGMDPETQTHLFEPFFTTKEQGKGTGLGLATVYGIIKQSGGYVWAYSELGHGTTFKVYLPQVADEKSEAELVRPVSIMTQGSETILLVEDEMAVRQLVHEILRTQGYTVLEASGEEAIALSAQYEGPIDLLLTDVVMPRINGRELAAELLQTRPQLKVLYMSGYTDNVMLHHGLMTQEIAFLQKPFTPARLAEKVRTVLDN